MVQKIHPRGVIWGPCFPPPVEIFSKNQCSFHLYSIPWLIKMKGRHLPSGLSSYTTATMGSKSFWSCICSLKHPRMCRHGYWICVHKVLYIYLARKPFWSTYFKPTWTRWGLMFIGKHRVMVLHKMRFQIHRALMYFFLSVASKVRSNNENHVWSD